MAKDKNQKSPGPLVTPTGKIAGTQDFSGQDSGYPSVTPAAEVATNQEAPVNYQMLPGERGTRKLKVFDGAAIEQLLGTRRTY